MLKVCMVVHNYFYHDARVRRYADALADAGVRVDVICPRASGPSSTKARAEIRVFSIPIGHGKGGLKSLLLEYVAAFFFYSLWLLALYVKNRYTIIHVHNMPDFLVFTALLPKLLGAKVILDIHDPMPEFYMSKYRAAGATVRFLRLEERLAAQFADAVIPANPNFARNLIARGIPADKITVVNNVADPRVFDRERFRRQQPSHDEHFTLIYPGTIAPRYGLAVAICAVPQLVTRIPQLRILIIGAHTAHQDELMAQAQQLGVSRYVQFQPIIPADEVPLRVSQADVGIYLALPDAHMSIATPTKVLEYAIMGIPIIASRLPILESLFGDSAVQFFEPGNAEQFAHCVVQLFESPARRAQLVQEADRVYVSTHSWSVERAAYFALLQRLVPSADSALSPSRLDRSAEGKSGEFKRDS
jgi:glycosyltransferase involved in cell wall biosynthesis